MDSPILPILIGGGVLAAVVLGSRSASAQDDDYGDDYGGDDYGGAGPYLNVPRIPTLPDVGGNGGAGGYDPGEPGGDYGGGGGGGFSVPSIPGTPNLTGNFGQLRINVRTDIPDGEIRVRGWSEMRIGGRALVYDERFPTREAKQRGLALEVRAGFYQIDALAGGRRVSNLVRANVRTGQVTSLLLTAA